MPAVAEGGGAGCSQMALNIDGLGIDGLDGGVAGLTGGDLAARVDEFDFDRAAGGDLSQ